MNQQPQGGETRNLIVAVVLSMAVFVVWFLLFPTPDKAKQRNFDDVKRESKLSPVPGIPGALR